MRKPKYDVAASQLIPATFDCSVTTMEIQPTILHSITASSSNYTTGRQQKSIVATTYFCLRHPHFQPKKQGCLKFFFFFSFDLPLLPFFPGLSGVKFRIANLEFRIVRNKSGVSEFFSAVHLPAVSPNAINAPLPIQTQSLGSLR